MIDVRIYSRYDVFVVKGSANVIGMTAEPLTLDGCSYNSKVTALILDVIVRTDKNWKR